MINQRGGIISKLFIIPMGVALVVGFFFLGYSVGKYQKKAGVSGEMAPPLPEIASSAGQKQDEFTFYKTLADKNDRTVSVDLKPKTVKEDARPVKQQTTSEVPISISVPPASKEKRSEIEHGKEALSSARPGQLASKQPLTPVRKETARASASTKLRYTVQTAAYQERDMAADEVKRLKQKGFAAFIVSSPIQGKGVWHRVRLGSFSSRAAAEKLQKTIHDKEGIQTIVVLE